MEWLSATLEQGFVQAVMVGARIGMLMVFAPFLGSQAIPARVKAGLTVALTALLYPVYAPRVIPAGLFPWPQILAGEMLAGLMLGLTVHFVFDGVQLAGQVVGFQMGYSLASVLDPESQIDTPVLAIFHQAIALLIFLQIDGAHLLLRALTKSLEYLPPGAVAVTPATAEGMVRAAMGMLLVAVQIAAPVLAVTLLTDVALGFIGRASPQLPVLFLGLSVKNLAGLAVLIGALAFWPGVLGRMFTSAVASAERLLHLAQ